MAYVETTGAPEDGATISTGEYYVVQFYDDIWLEWPYYSAMFYLDGVYVGAAGTNHELNYTGYNYNFTVEKDYTWHIIIYNDETDEWQTGPTHNFTVLENGVGAPSEPTTPSPANNATEVDFSGFTLSWEDGGGADTYNIYIGPSGSLTLRSAAQAGTSYVTNISEVPYGEKIYWRVDAINAGGTTTGNVWNFAAYPGAPTNPYPADDASGITLDDTVVTWEAGANTDSFDVYFRPYGEFFERIASDTTDLSVDAIVAHTPAFNGHYSYGQLYLWCVIAKNQFGLNYSPPSDFGIGYGGTIWQFNAMLFDPPLPYGITLDWSGDEPTGNPTGTPTGENFMMAIRGLVAAANNRIWYEDI